MKHVARKRFGQNFLHDTNVIDKIVRHIRPQAGQNIVEIGPGQGALSLPLLEAVGALQVVELDRDLIPILKATLSTRGDLTIHQADALKFDFSTLFDDRKLRVVGNLPYNISTPLMFHLLNQSEIIQDMHFMLQKEVVDRMAAEPNSKAYGRLSVMLQLTCQVEKLFDVGPGAFKPAPKVDSAIVRLIPHPSPTVDVSNKKDFAQLVTQLFNHRRKMLRATLKDFLSSAEIEALNIDPRLRPEALDLATFAALANAWTAKKQTDV